MRAFHCFMWLSGLGLLHAGCAPIVNIGDTGDAGDDSATTADSGGSGSCASDLDCAANQICGFASGAACNAHGQCFAAPELTCELYSAGCACDGTDINVACTGLPAGYTPEPLLHTGACGDASPPADSGAGDAGPMPCVTDSDCSAGSYCGYLASAACNARGQCLPFAGGVMGVPVAPACACDGTEVNEYDVYLPTGYVPKPIAHLGACIDASPPADAGGGDTGPVHCVGDSDCPSSEHCGYLYSEACSAQGLCFPAPSNIACDLVLVQACACDGTGTTYGCDADLPPGYVPLPIAHLGSCGDASPPVDSGGGDSATVPCAVDTDCPSDDVCGFLDTAGCGAVGQCFPAMTGTYNCPADFGGCACDGTDVPTGCDTGLPQGYSRKPLQHTGMCADASSSADAGSSADAPSSPCGTDGDCPSGETCGFLESEACSATGSCVPMNTSICNSYLAGCACDGTDINIGCTLLPAGYAIKPLRSTGACLDASASDATPPVVCATNADCPTDYLCGFPESEACSAKGTCFQSPGAVCLTYSAGCACDGSVINVACTGLPSGYETKPLLHAGMCADGG